MTELHHVIDGPDHAPVLVLGPSLGTDLGLFDAQVAALADHFRIIRFDLRGHGSSPAPDGPYTMAELAGDVLELADRLGVGRFHYAGVSIGGAIGQWLGIRHGDRLASLTVLASAAQFADPPSWPVRAATVRAEGTEAILASRTGTWFTERFAAERPDEAQRLLTMLGQTTREGYAGCCEAIATFDVRAELGRIATRTLVIAGAEDPATPVGMVRAIAEGIPGATFQVVPDAAHLLNAEQPAAVNDALRSHLGR
ncbi:3-oxoadipate enol-lactonase [Pseudonocardia asaccharolytica]|uniref:3-oxoadipate enol-lactonase n=1 Tax=Pseudonocardia asaccharolytica DSM 44247 = NBRC 16224 TaxID=1123024 RepID=A0A511CY83_9PSEU|nr:3-oxoadipate enol-lactonase [Pseudonocardia asaccharolytica]GEL17526.1 3-oxoadipate enol-lactonase [Pseudonocardia asaccharolytica DSM 44247 = NBRC 16224]